MSEQLLQQILEELKNVKGEISGIKQEQASMNIELQNVKSQMNSRFDTLETKTSHIQDDVSDIKNSVHRLEMNEPQDVLAMLKQVNQKLDSNQKIVHDIEDLETDIRLIKRMLTNQ